MTKVTTELVVVFKQLMDFLVHFFELLCLLNVTLTYPNTSSRMYISTSQILRNK
jgi:hypothetical protein